MSFPALLGGFVVFVLLFYGFAVWYSTSIVSAMIEKHHRNADFVINTGKVPPEWTRGVICRLFGRHIGKSIVVGRLRRIVRYFRFTPMVGDDETRTVILKKLEEIRVQWASSDWSDITVQTE